MEPLTMERSRELTVEAGSTGTVMWQINGLMLTPTSAPGFTRNIGENFQARTMAPY